jgi:hypothetical protein
LKGAADQFEGLPAVLGDGGMQDEVVLFQADFHGFGVGFPKWGLPSISVKWKVIVR